MLRIDELIDGIHSAVKSEMSSLKYTYPTLTDYPDDNGPEELGFKEEDMSFDSVYFEGKGFGLVFYLHHEGYALVPSKLSSKLYEGKIIKHPDKDISLLPVANIITGVHDFFNKNGYYLRPCRGNDNWIKYIPSKDKENVKQRERE